MGFVLPMNIESGSQIKQMTAVKMTVHHFTQTIIDPSLPMISLRRVMIEHDDDGINGAIETNSKQNRLCLCSFEMLVFYPTFGESKTCQDNHTVVIGAPRYPVQMNNLA